MTGMEKAVESDLVERLRSSEPLPACPYDKLSPHYRTASDDKPCAVCGGLNDPDAPDLCRGADTRIMGEAADEIESLRAQLLMGVMRREDVAREAGEIEQALKLAVFHIEHMAAWIGRQNAGYSFEGLGEDMPSIREAVSLAYDCVARRINCSRCQKPIENQSQVFRCTDCEMAMHRDCARAHFAESVEATKRRALPQSGQPAPGHTDLMVPPEGIDAFMEANPLPEHTRQPVKEEFANLVREVLDNSSGGTERFLRLPQALAKSGWFKRAKAILSSAPTSPQKREE